jgi:hypothetical protein
MQPKEGYLFEIRWKREFSCPTKKGHAITRAAQVLATRTQE